MVGVTGVEPAWIFIQRLLRPPRIPVSARIEKVITLFILFIVHSMSVNVKLFKKLFKKRIITFEHLKLRFSGVALCQKHRKRPLVSWITRSKRP